MSPSFLTWKKEKKNPLKCLLLFCYMIYERFHSFFFSLQLSPATKFMCFFGWLNIQSFHLTRSSIVDLRRIFKQGICVMRWLLGVLWLRILICELLGMAIISVSLSWNAGLGNMLSILDSWSWMQLEKVQQNFKTFHLEK